MSQELNTSQPSVLALKDPWRGGFEHRRLEMLADALMAAMNIQPGHGLVYLVGTGNEQSNRQAIIFWIARRRAEYSLLPVQQQFQQLRTALRQELERHLLGVIA